MGELRDRMEQDLILRRLSPSTRRNYLFYCRKFAEYYWRNPEELGEEEIREYLIHLIDVKQVSSSTYRQIVAALKFLYTVTLSRPWMVERIPFPRHRRPRLAKVLQEDQILQLFAALRRSKSHRVSSLKQPGRDHPLSLILPRLPFTTNSKT